MTQEELQSQEKPMLGQCQSKEVFEIVQGLLQLQKQKKPNGAARTTEHKGQVPNWNGKEEGFKERAMPLISSRSRSSQKKTEGDFSKQKVGPEDFLLLKRIGKGSFGEVFLTQKKDSKQILAMKILDKRRIFRTSLFFRGLTDQLGLALNVGTESNLIRYAIAEKHVMEKSLHSFIIKLHSSFQTKDRLFLVMDFCPNGDLSNHLQRERCFSEEKAKFYTACILLALEDLHHRNIIFRDLKPENILIDKEGFPVLSDFGLSKEGVYETINGTKSFCGSVAYLAPEMVKKSGHGKVVDWYLLGVLVYEMLVGMPPYYDDERSILLDNILNGKLRIPSKLSKEAKSLIISVLLLLSPLVKEAAHAKKPPEPLGSQKRLGRHKGPSILLINRLESPIQKVKTQNPFGPTSSIGKQKTGSTSFQIREKTRLQFNETRRSE